MATSTVVNNPFDTQQPKATQPGLISGAMANNQQGQTATTAPKGINVFGLDWDSSAPLSTKQGYITNLLVRGVTPDQLKQKIAEIDPANANDNVYNMLGIPPSSGGSKAPSPAPTAPASPGASVAKPATPGSTASTPNAPAPTSPAPATAPFVQTATQAPSSTAQTYTPTIGQIDRATQTAGGQVESMLAKDSPLMQRARTLALQNMNQRGLVNSSMAQGAGVAAMIDRITPIAQQDAETYANQALANQNAQNTAGQFNAGEANKFGLQRSDQSFTAAENLANRQFQTSERVSGQAFTAEQNKATQDFQAAQAQLDRAQQTALADKSIEATQALELARQRFQTAESALDRANQKALQESQQIFQGNQNQLDRVQQVNLQNAAQTFQATENEKNRAADIMLADKNISAQKALQQAQQEFQRGENVLDRTQQQTLQTAQQEFQRAQSDLDRALQTSLSDKSIEAQKSLQTAQQNFQSTQASLDRAQQQTLQTAQQEFTRAQAELDRAQQTAINDKSIEAQKALQTAQQNFQSAEAVLDRTQQSTIADRQIAAQQSLQTAQQSFQSLQAQLDRDQQTALVKLQDSLNTANVSKTFAANLATGTLNAINAIQADPNTTPDAKKAAIKNVIDTGNATMQWGASFYQATLPTIAVPGETARVVTPGAGSATATQKAFDPVAYLKANPDVAAAGVDPTWHYNVQGWREGRTW